MVTIPAPPQVGGYVKPPRTTPGAGTKNPYSNPAPRPMTLDYAAPSIYQSSDPYKGKIVPGQPGTGNPPPTWNNPPYSHNNVNPSSTPVTPPVSSFTPPTQPLSANATGQYSLAAGASPFNVQQIAQTPTTVGTPQKPKQFLKPIVQPISKKKKKSSLDKYLGKDSDYQNTLRDLTRALADFKARQGTEKTRAGTEFGYAKRTMGTQSQQDLSDIQNDAAARGIATSGVYGQRVGDYNTTYNEQLAELGRQYKSQLDDFASSLRDFSRQQSLQKEAARTAAIRRRAAKLGKVG